jgi:charged multivesicular body protein 5
MRDGPGKSTLKQRAMQLLKQRRQIESQKQQLENQSWNITQTQITTDNLKNSMMTYDVMKQTNKELKKTYGKIDVDKVLDLQDEMMDMMESAAELQGILGASYDVPDELSEGELDAELEALGEEMEWENEMGQGVGGVPSYLQDTGEVPQFIDEPVEGEKEKEVAQ